VDLFEGEENYMTDKTPPLPAERIMDFILSFVLPVDSDSDYAKRLRSLGINYKITDYEKMKKEGIEVIAQELVNARRKWEAERKIDLKKLAEQVRQPPLKGNK
jgi:hypothetical protein